METTNYNNKNFDSSAFLHDPDFALEALNFSELCNKTDDECIESCLNESDAQSTQLDKKRAMLQVCPFATKDIRLVIEDNAFHASVDTTRLLRAIGGPAAIHRLTARFYQHFVANAHLSQFILDEAETHAQRLGNWIVEKMGGGPVWTEGTDGMESARWFYSNSSFFIFLFSSCSCFISV
jgi:hypothetical protein